MQVERAKEALMVCDMERFVMAYTFMEEGVSYLLPRGVDFELTFNPILQTFDSIDFDVCRYMNLAKERIWNALHLDSVGNQIEFNGRVSWSDAVKTCMLEFSKVRLYSSFEHI